MFGSCFHSNFQIHKLPRMMPVFREELYCISPKGCSFKVNFVTWNEWPVTVPLSRDLLQDGKFWPARLNSTKLGDVYGVVMDRQRGNRPIILPRDDILKEAVSGQHFSYGRSYLE